MTNTSEVKLTASGRFTIAHDNYVIMKAEDSPYNLYKFEIGNSANVTPFEFINIDYVSGSPEFAILHFEN